MPCPRSLSVSTANRDELTFKNSRRAAFSTRNDWCKTSAQLAKPLLLSDRRNSEADKIRPRWRFRTTRPINSLLLLAGLLSLLRFLGFLCHAVSPLGYWAHRRASTPRTATVGPIRLGQSKFSGDKSIKFSTAVERRHQKRNGDRVVIVS
jgi:hypothetical protein